LYCIGPPLDRLSFPTRRSSDLRRRTAVNAVEAVGIHVIRKTTGTPYSRDENNFMPGYIKIRHNPLYLRKDRIIPASRTPANILIDRKSTRLNSSHLGISYAVFC